MADWNWRHYAVGGACVTLVAWGVFELRKKLGANKRQPKGVEKKNGWVADEAQNANFARLREEIQKVEATLSKSDQAKFLDYLKIFNSFFELAVVPGSEGLIRVAQEIIMALTLRNCTMVSERHLAELLEQLEGTLSSAISDEGMHPAATEAALQAVPGFIDILKQPHHYRQAANH